MVPRLADHLNQSILVSIPVLHSDVKCRSYILVGVDLQGLWLQSDELLRDVSDEAENGTPASTPVFVPFSQIASVVLSAPARKIAGFPASLRTPATPPRQAPAPAIRTAKRKRSGADADKGADVAQREKRGK
jgi:hypothetical protein